MYLLYTSFPIMFDYMHYLYFNLKNNNNKKNKCCKWKSQTSAMWWKVFSSLYQKKFHWPKNFAWKSIAPHLIMIFQLALSKAVHVSALLRSVTMMLLGEKEAIDATVLNDEVKMWCLFIWVMMRMMMTTTSFSQDLSERNSPLCRECVWDPECENRTAAGGKLTHPHSARRPRFLVQRDLRPIRLKEEERSEAEGAGLKTRRTLIITSQGKVWNVA